MDPPVPSSCPPSIVSLVGQGELPAIGDNETGDIFDDDEDAAAHDDDDNDDNDNDNDDEDDDNDDDDNDDDDNDDDDDDDDNDDDDDHTRPVTSQPKQWLVSVRCSTLLKRKRCRYHVISYIGISW